MKGAEQPRAGTHAIRTEVISKHFGAVRAIDELSLAVSRGVTTSVVGPNGSGKSTLVNVLSGVLPLDGGLVVLDGARLRVVRAHEISQRGLTRTFQEVRLFDQITVYDNILVVLTERRLLPALLQRRNRGLQRQAREILELVGMWEKTGRPGRRTLLRAAQIDRDRPGPGDGRRDLSAGRAFCRPVPADGRTRESDPAADARRKAHHRVHFPQHGNRAANFPTGSSSWKVARCWPRARSDRCWRARKSSRPTSVIDRIQE